MAKKLGFTSTVVYVDPIVLEEFQNNIDSFDQKTKAGGMSEKIRELMILYNCNPQKVDNLIREVVPMVEYPIKQEVLGEPSSKVTSDDWEKYDIGYVANIIFRSCLLPIG